MTSYSDAIPAPPLNIPSSTHHVHVQLIDTTSQINGIAIAPFLEPAIKGHDTLNCPAFAFLITHPELKRSLLFDLGVRKDWENFAPKLVAGLKHYAWDITVQKNICEILEEKGVDLRGIEGMIWSHWHWDHTGDPSTFPESAALIVGPGFKDAFVPGFPANPDAVILESDYEGRELREVSFTEGKVVKIGNFKALDYFGDGSFYILDAPGHAIGHLCALARVKGEDGKEGFVFMGGDACHHNGEFRPSPYKPLPKEITPHHWEAKEVPCPGSIFHSILRDGDPTKPFYAIVAPADNAPSAMAHNPQEARETIQKVMETDADEKVLVVMAHDDSLLGVLNFFPGYLDGFVGKGWVEEGRWNFLRDFRGAV